MRVLYDITTLGHIHCAKGVRPTGIFKHTEAMGLALEQQDEVDLDLCSSASQYRKAVRYLNETGKFGVERFALTSGLPGIAESNLSSVIHGSEFNGSIIQGSLHKHLALTYDPEAVCNSGNYDVYHVNWRGCETLPSHSSANIVLTIYDVIALKNPEWFVAPGEPNPLGDYLHQLLSSVRPRHFITTSTEAVKADILDLFPHISRDQIFVTPLGASENFGLEQVTLNRTALNRKYGVPERAPFILCVNTLEPRKNMVAAIDAYLELFASPQHKNVSLVLAGSKGWLSEEISERAGGEANIVITGYVDDEDLPALYSEAAVFCYPSLDEGFGMPVVEAMKSGVPVVTSNRAPLMEVSGGAAVCVDPNSPLDISKALSQVLSDKDVAEDLRQKGLARAQELRWENSAKRMLNVYKDLPGRTTGATRSKYSTTEVTGTETVNENTIARHVPPVSDLRGEFRGERVFILGDGPSLDRVPLQLLQNEHAIAVNKFFESQRPRTWKPTFYVVECGASDADFTSEVNALTGSTFIFEESLRSALRQGPDVSYFRRSETGPETTEDLITVAGPRSAVNAAIQIALELGFSEIYLLGTNTLEESMDYFFGEATTSDGLREHQAAIEAWHSKVASERRNSSQKIFVDDWTDGNSTYPRVDLHALLASDALPNFEREAHMSLDETHVISTMVKDDETQRVMIDVGAHRGHSAKHFVNKNWQIYCFEPDTDNREKHLRKKFGDRPNLTIDPRAVSDEPNDGVAFFTSEESSGISGLHAFRDSHTQSNLVEVTTIENVISQYEIDRIDFLKIDVEGFDFSVLKGVPWNKIKPAIIECEYEDYKTVPMGHRWQDIAHFLRDRGYTVYISEWHPIIRYGIPHDWRRVTAFPGIDIPSNSWGNILAFIDDPGIDEIQRAFARLAKPHTSDVGQVSVSRPQKSAAAVQEPKRSAHPADLAATSPPVHTDTPVTHRPFYAGFGDKLRASSPRVFTILQFVRRASTSLFKRPLALMPLVALPALILALSFIPGLAEFRFAIWTMAAIALLAGIVFYIAFRLYRTTVVLSTQLSQLHRAQSEADTALRERISRVDSMRRNSDAALTRDTQKRVSELTAMWQKNLSETSEAIRLDFSMQSAALAQSIEQVESNMSQLQNKLGSNESQTLREVQDLRTEIEAFRSTIETQSSELARSVEDLDAETTALVQRADALEGQRKSLEELTKAELERVKEQTEKNSTAQAVSARKINRQAFQTNLLSDRLATSEQQIGNILYPDPPKALVFFGHHKCASRFFRNHVFAQIAKSTGASTRRYHVEDPPFHYSRADELDNCNLDLSELGSEKREIVLYANASERSLAKFTRLAPEDWRGIRIIRDPRQVLVSNYFHHRGDHDAISDEAGWVWDQLVVDKPILRELPEADGILHELNNISKDVIENQILAPFEDERIMTIKLEEFALKPAYFCSEISKFLEVPTIAGVNFDAKNANPDAKSWRQVFTTKIRDEFKQRYGERLIEIGYADDLEW